MHDEEFERRSVLKSFGGAAGAGAIAPGAIDSQGASEVDASTREQLLGDVNAVSDVRAVLETNVEPVVEALSDEGYLDEGSLSEFDGFGGDESINHESSDVRVGALSIPDLQGGETTSHIRADADFEEYKIELYSQPEHDRSYAIVTPKDAAGNLERSRRELVRTEEGEVKLSSNCEEVNRYCTDDKADCGGCSFFVQNYMKVIIMSCDSYSYPEDYACICSSGCV